MPDDPDIADELAYMAEHSAMFTKAEMAEMMKAAEGTIRSLRDKFSSLRDEIDIAINAFGKAEVGQILVRRKRSRPAEED